MVALGQQHIFISMYRHKGGFGRTPSNPPVYRPAILTDGKTTILTDGNTTILTDGKRTILTDGKTTILTDASTRSK